MNDATPGFASNFEMGNFFPGDGLALVDDKGTVLQFVSYNGETTTADTGPAAGMTSSNIGTQPENGSLQSDDGGRTYYAQSSSNPGTIPACFAAGTLIRTHNGDIAVEHLSPGDLVKTQTNGVQPLIMVLREDCEITDPRHVPIMIKRGALGGGRPTKDLVVSAQHCIVAGDTDQLPLVAETAMLCRAKGLTRQSGIRAMHGKRRVVWYHLIFQAHQIITANGCLTESMYLGPLALASLGAGDRRALAKGFGVGLRDLGGLHQPVLEVMPVKQTQRRVDALKVDALKQETCLPSCQMPPPSNCAAINAP